MLTTSHEVGDEHRTVKLRRGPRITSTTGARSREVFGNRKTKRIPIPTGINDYRTNMGAVDIADQLYSAYRTHLKGLRSWPPVLFWILDVSVSNSYRAMASKHPGKWQSKRSGHREFRIALAHCLMSSGPSHTRNTMPSAGEPPTPSKFIVNGSARATTRKRRRRSSELTVSTARPDNPVAQIAASVGSAKERRTCGMCSSRDQSQKFFTYYTGCRERTFLCIAATPNCFYEFHTMSDGRRLLHGSDDGDYDNAM